MLGHPGFRHERSPDLDMRNKSVQCAPGTNHPAPQSPSQAQLSTQPKSVPLPLVREYKCYIILGFLNSPPFPGFNGLKLRINFIHVLQAIVFPQTCFLGSVESKKESKGFFQIPASMVCLQQKSFSHSARPAVTLGWRASYK